MSLDGTYTATYQLLTGSIYNVSIMYEQQPLPTLSHLVTLLPSSVHPPNCLIDGYFRNGVVKNQYITLTLILKDHYGNIITPNRTMNLMKSLQLWISSMDINQMDTNAVQYAVEHGILRLQPIQPNVTIVTLDGMINITYKVMEIEEIISHDMFDSFDESYKTLGLMD